MDPRLNPYAPGAGSAPPELAGRDAVVERAAVALDRIAAGRAARSFVFYGLRGVGKTVLLNKVRLDAEARGHAAGAIEAPEGRSLPASLAPVLRAVLLRLSLGARAKAKAKADKALATLGNFVRAFKVKFGDIELGVEARAPAGVADSGDLALDLGDLLLAVGEAARERGTMALIAIDELQYVPEEQLAALLAALHRASQHQVPVAVVAAGLPQLLGRMGKAKSYAERLFEFVEVGPLDAPAARDAIEKPALKSDVAFADAALAAILRETQGYPYFLQEWGKHCWNLADASPIPCEVAEAATTAALAELDAGFFRVRYDRLTQTEKRYLRAMADLGPGPHRSGDIAKRLGQKVTSVAPIRNNLVAKGMVFSQAHGDTAFTVPLFDGFMRRVMPDLPPS